MNRRTLLAGIGTVSIAGCLSGDPLDIGNSDVVMNGVAITNFQREDKRVEIQVADQEQTFVDRTVVAEAAEYDEDDSRRYGGATLDCEWPDSPGIYTARARFEGESEWAEITSTDEYDEGCELFEFVIEGHGLDGS